MSDILQITNHIDIDKEHIITLFNTHVKGVKICLEECQNIKHSGKEGYWLETKMDIKHNAKNEPDINGYEMKKSSNKIILGDFSASEYLFSGKNKKIIFDSGMYDGNKRNYSHFRGTYFWNELIIEEY